MNELKIFRDLRTNGHHALVDALEVLLSDYPNDQHSEIKARLAVDDQVMDTLLELSTYRLLHHAGHKVKTIHPDLSDRGMKGHPDFLVDLGEETEAIVEVTFGSAASQKLKDEDGEMTRMMSGLEPYLKDGDWSFQLWFRTNKGGGIAYGKLAAEIRRQVAARTTAEHEAGFRFEWEHLTIQLQESRKREPGAPGVIGVFSCGWLKDEIESLPLVDRIRRVLGEKVKHYGPVTQPFILVVGLDGYFEAGQDEILDALLGRRQATFVRHPDGSHETHWGRDVDGFFGIPTKPKNTRLSGILFIGNWNMTTLAAHFHDQKLAYPAGWGLYITNPYAACPVLDPFPSLPRLLLISAAGQDWMAQEGREGLLLIPSLFGQS